MKGLFIDPARCNPENERHNSRVNIAHGWSVTYFHDLRPSQIPAYDLHIHKDKRSENLLLLPTAYERVKQKCNFVAQDTQNSDRSRHNKQQKKPDFGHVLTVFSDYEISHF